MILLSIVVLAASTGRGKRPLVRAFLPQTRPRCMATGQDGRIEKRRVSLSKPVAVRAAGHLSFPA